MMHLGLLVCIMAINITNGTHMVNIKLRVLPRSKWMLGVLCKGICIVVIRRVGLLTSPLRLVVSPVPTSLSFSLPLFVIGGMLIGKVLLSINLSLNMRIQGRSRCRLSRWWVVDRSRWRGCKSYRLDITRS